MLGSTSDRWSLVKRPTVFIGRCAAGWVRETERQDVAEAYERAAREANDAFAGVIEAQEDGDLERFRDARARNEKLTRDAREAALEFGLGDCAP